MLLKSCVKITLDFVSNCQMDVKRGIMVLKRWCQNSIGRSIPALTGVGPAISGLGGRGGAEQGPTEACELGADAGLGGELRAMRPGGGRADAARRAMRARGGWLGLWRMCAEAEQRVGQRRGRASWRVQSGGVLARPAKGVGARVREGGSQAASRC
jgi:hypothetical protein